MHTTTLCLALILSLVGAVPVPLFPQLPGYSYSLNVTIFGAQGVQTKNVPYAATSLKFNATVAWSSLNFASAAEAEFFFYGTPKTGCQGFSKETPKCTACNLFSALKNPVPLDAAYVGEAGPNKVEFRVAYGVEDELALDGVERRLARWLREAEDSASSPVPTPTVNPSPSKKGSFDYVVDVADPQNPKMVGMRLVYGSRLRFQAQFYDWTYGAPNPAAFVNPRPCPAPSCPSPSVVPCPKPPCPTPPPSPCASCACASIPIFV